MFATDWASSLPKRVIKFAFKRSLGRLLKGDVDLEQMDVQLSTGRLELRDVLLNVDHINESFLVWVFARKNVLQRVCVTIPCMRTAPVTSSQPPSQSTTPWRLTAGVVCRLGAVVPFTSLTTTPCEVTLEDVVIHVQLLSPNQLKQQHSDTNAPQPAVGTSPPSSSPSHPAEDEEQERDAVLGGSSIADGVRLIAGGIETLLHQLRVRVRNLSVHIVAPPEHHGDPQVRLLVSLAAFDFCSRDQLPSEQVEGNAAQGGCGGDVPSSSSGGDGVPSKSLLLDKHCSFEGLLLELAVQPDEEEDGGGVRRDAAVGVDAPRDHEDAKSDDGRESQLSSSVVLGDDDVHDDASSSPSSSPSSNTADHEQQQSHPSPSPSPPHSNTPHFGVLLCNNEGAGCSAAVHVRLESSDGLQSGNVHVHVDVEPMQVQLHSAHVGYVCMLVQRASAGGNGGGSTGPKGVRATRYCFGFIFNFLLCAGVFCVIIQGTYKTPTS